MPGDASYDDARRPWNSAVDQRPAAVVHPASTAEVAAVVRAATALGLRVAPQGTGHCAAAVQDLGDAVLLRTSALTGVEVDPDGLTVTVGAGTLWDEAVTAAAAHGLAVLHGSSPDVGVVGYCLGGGIGWYARALGMAAHSVLSAEVVLPDGSVVRAGEGPGEDADLLWALRGGGGFGIVTRLTLRAHRFSTACAGMLVWDAARVEEVLPAWAAWAADAPVEVTTSFRLLRMPPLPSVPEVFRGRHLVLVDGAVLGGAGHAEQVLAPLRALGPEMDTFADVPVASLTRLHMDPEGPTPVVSRSVLVREFPAEAARAFLDAAGPGSGTALLGAEVRQLGGRLAEPSPTAALSHLKGAFLVFGGSLALDEDGHRAGWDSATRLLEAVAPWSDGATYPNFTEEPGETSRAFTPQAWERLQQLKERYDAGAAVVTAHPVTPAGTPARTASSAVSSTASSAVSGTTSGAGLPAPWTPGSFAAADAFLTAEMATLGRDGTPVAWPVVAFPDPVTGHLTVTTSIGLPVKAFNVRRDARVSLLFSDPTGSARPDAPQVLVRGRATCPDVVHADPRGLEDYWRRLFERQPAGAGGSRRATRALMGWYYLRLVITVVPEDVELRPAPGGDGSPLGSLLEVPRRRRGGTVDERLQRVLARERHRTAVLSWAAADGSPRSARVGLLDGPGSGEGFLLDVPEREAVVAGPATLLAHSHDEQLWNQRVTGAWGAVQPTADGWRFTPRRLAPKFPTSPLGVLAFARRARGTADRYLQRRGLAHPAVDWDAYEALHAPRGQRPVRRG
nr:FAD-binding protein [Kineococcus aurantiacus]